jgi:uncharacterized protein (DUF1778 family)
MVTKLAGNRAQVTLKGTAISDDWEQLVKVAASRNGQTIADFVVDTTRAAALAIVKNEPAVPAAVPARIEDVAASLSEQLTKLATDQDARMAALERQTRRFRWRH